ncbi:MAG: hypothetical protein EGR16_08940 [Clostridiales bacterium]|nr:hypothetical protein [Clostridiales bacterium]
MQVQKEVTQLIASVTKAVTLDSKVAIVTEAPPYRRTKRRIRPTPKPTNATMTNMRIRGLEVMAPTKEPTHLIASVTKEVTLDKIVAIATGVSV